MPLRALSAHQSLPQRLGAAATIPGQARLWILQTLQTSLPSTSPTSSSKRSNGKWRWMGSLGAALSQTHICLISTSYNLPHTNLCTPYVPMDSLRMPITLLIMFVVGLSHHAFLGPIPGRLVSSVNRCRGCPCRKLLMASGVGPSVHSITSTSTSIDTQYRCLAWHRFLLSMQCEMRKTCHCCLLMVGWRGR